MINCCNFCDKERNHPYLGLIHLKIEHNAKVKREMESSGDYAGMSDNSVGDLDDSNHMQNRVIFFSD